jgi:fatty-acyl-CoA synthase
MKRGLSVDFPLFLWYNRIMIFETIKQASWEHGSNTALVWKDKQYTYTELVESVEQLAAILSTAVRPGESILFASEKEYHYVRMVLACDILGITFIPTHPNLPEDYLFDIIDACKPDHVIMSEEDALDLKPHNKGLVYVKDDNATYTILFTSGTNGNPSAVVHSAAGCMLGCLHSISIHKLTSDDVILSQLPPSTIAGLYLYALPGLMKGATVIVEQFEPRRYIELCNKWKPTIGTMVPAMLLALQKVRKWKDYSMSHYRQLSIGSTAITTEVIDLLFDKGVPLVRHLYGCTETHVPALTYLIEPDTKHKLQLEVLEFYEHKLDRFGVLWLKGPTVTRQYLNSEETIINSEGYWCTGDVFERKHNKLIFKTRAKDLIKVNSFNVSPLAVENAILSCDGVDEVCVTYRERGLGEKELVAVIRSDDSELNKYKITEHIKKKLMHYELPKEVIIVTEDLPRNAMGKIKRHIVKDILRKGELNEI